MKTFIRKLCCVLAVFLVLLNFGFAVFAAEDSDEMKVTGYYYDPAAGKLLPKYNNLSPKEVERYLLQQAYAKKIAEYQKLSYKKFADVPPEFIQFLTKAQIASIPSDAWFNKLSAQQKASLTAEQVQALNTRKISIASLTPAQREALTAAQVKTLSSYKEFQYLPVSKISALTAGQIRSIPNNAEFIKLSSEQRAAFTATQVQMLNTRVISISALTLTQRGALTVTQVRTLGSYKEFQYLPVSKISALTAGQISSIPSAAEFNKFSDPQVLALTKAQVKAIPNAYYKQIASRLSPQQRAWRK